MSSLFCLPAYRTSKFEFPAPTTYLRCRQSRKKITHIFTRPWGPKRERKLQPNRKPLKGSVIFRGGRGVTRLGSPWTNEKWALEGSVCEQRKWGCMWGVGREMGNFGGRAWCFRAWEQEWIKDKMCQWESEHVWKMCLPQPFHLLHRGAIATAWRCSVVSR